MEKKTQNQRIEYLELLLIGDDSIHGIPEQLESINEKITTLQESFTKLNHKMDRIIQSYIVVGGVLMFLFYLIQTAEKLPIYIKPERTVEKTK